MNTTLFPAVSANKPIAQSLTVSEVKVNTPVTITSTVVKPDKAARPPVLTNSLVAKVPSASVPFNLIFKVVTLVKPV